MVAGVPKVLAVHSKVNDEIFPPFAFGVDPQMLQPGSAVVVVAGAVVVVASHTACETGIGRRAGGSERGEEE